MQPLIRLTAGQALVRYLASQWSERDGNSRRAIPGIFGIFGHGNVCGLGPALEEQEGRALAFHQPKNEQAMVHAAIGYARACNLLSTLACTASVGPGSTNLLTGAATATVNRVPVLLLPSDTFAQRRGDPVMQALEHPREADLTGHTTELIAALAAVVIGGASLTGGIGRMSSTVVGVFIPVVLANGLLIGGVERFWQDVVVGVILVAAVWFDGWRRAREVRDL
jgi:Thiamine pyrophosphate enzyme, N-terminal TPP binding domain